MKSQTQWRDGFPVSGPEQPGSESAIPARRAETASRPTTDVRTNCVWQLIALERLGTATAADTRNNGRR